MIAIKENSSLDSILWLIGVLSNQPISDYLVSDVEWMKGTNQYRALEAVLTEIDASPLEYKELGLVNVDVFDVNDTSFESMVSLVFVFVLSTVLLCRYSHCYNLELSDLNSLFMIDQDKSVSFDFESFASNRQDKISYCGDEILDTIKKAVSIYNSYISV